MAAAGRYRLAIYNFGLHVGPEGHPAVEGFVLREPANFEAAWASDFVGRSGYGGEPGPRSWGAQVFPRFIQGSGFDSAPSSLSLWKDMESLMAFSYNDVHADALKHGRNWNVRPRWPPLELWWVDEGHTPDWSEGVERLEYLHDNGASARAFTSKNPSPPMAKFTLSTGSMSVRSRSRPFFLLMFGRWGLLGDFGASRPLLRPCGPLSPRPGRRGSKPQIDMQLL